MFTTRRLTQGSTHFTSQTPWRLKTAWIEALYHRTKRICNNNNLFTGQLKLIASFMSWNGFLKHIRNSIMNKLKTNLSTVLNKLNFFDSNIQVTVDHLPDAIVHFLDLKVNGNQTDVYYKETHTGQYTHFTSQTPWCLKTAWIEALYHRTKRISNNNNLFTGQLKLIASFMSWNGFLKHIRNSIMNKLKTNWKGKDPRLLLMTGELSG